MTLFQCVFVFLLSGLLTVLLYTINDVALGPGWGENKGQSGIGGFMGGGGHLDSFHVLRANKTGSYLCMDDHSVPYQTVSNK